MEMICHHCSREIPAEHINQEKKYAHCRHCNAIFTLTDDNKLVPMGVTVQQEADALLIKRKWLSCIGYGLIAFAILFNIPIWTCILPTMGGASPSILLLLSPFLIGGLIVAYFGLVYILNSTQIQVNREAIHVQHGPLQIYRSSRVPVGDIQQLSTRKKVQRGARSNTSVKYQLWAIRHDGTEVNVLDNLEQAEFALFIEKEVERYLGITNRPVDGEYQPS